MLACSPWTNQLKCSCLHILHEVRKRLVTSTIWSNWLIRDLCSIEQLFPSYRRRKWWKLAKSCKNTPSNHILESSFFLKMHKNCIKMHCLEIVLQNLWIWCSLDARGGDTSLVDLKEECYGPLRNSISMFLDAAWWLEPQQFCNRVHFDMLKNGQS